MGSRLVASVVAAVALAAGAAACSRPPAFDRERAITEVQTLDPSVSREQAACYVDRVAAELGPGALRPDGSVPPEQISRRTGIRVDCIGVANLGTAAPTTVGAADPGERSWRPDGPGDDPVLDRLYRRCGAGDGPACDLLFDEAPVGSAYEEFASTCGNRTRELRCADAYPGPSTTRTTTASAPPTPP